MTTTETWTSDRPQIWRGPEGDVDVDTQNDIAQEAGIKAMPTFTVVWSSLLAPAVQTRSGVPRQR
nr:hypothetical protein [Streptomyces sp. S10(2018)]